MPSIARSEFISCHFLSAFSVLLLARVAGAEKNASVRQKTYDYGGWGEITCGVTSKKRRHDFAVRLDDSVVMRTEVHVCRRHLVGAK